MVDENIYDKLELVINKLDKAIKKIDNMINTAERINKRIDNITQEFGDDKYYYTYNVNYDRLKKIREVKMSSPYGINTRDWISFIGF
jgi:hypothetical protein